MSNKIEIDEMFDVPNLNSEVKGLSVEFVDDKSLDSDIIDETLRLWVATRINGASMSMMMSGTMGTDKYLLKAFDKLANIVKESVK